jgi:uncharacterized protein YjiS (DUF1127 family)
MGTRPGNLPVLHSERGRNAPSALLQCNIVTGDRVNSPYLLTNCPDHGLWERMRDMRDLTHNAATLLDRPTAGESAFAAAIKAAWAWIMAPVRMYLEREQTLRELSGLDERSLADIGLTRGDVRSVVAGDYRRGGLAEPKLDPGA